MCIGLMGIVRVSRLENVGVLFGGGDCRGGLGGVEGYSRLVGLPGLFVQPNQISWRSNELQLISVSMKASGMQGKAHPLHAQAPITYVYYFLRLINFQTIRKFVDDNTQAVHLHN